MTEETRARIAAVIERTGYRPRAAARNLRSSRTNLIGVILADIANPFSSAMLEGLSASAAARGCSLMTAISGNDPAKEAESLARLIDAGVDGLVFLRLTEALAQLGPSLPAGLKIATFDDYPWNHVLFGGVTTAAQDTLAIAERVVVRLSERIDIVTTTVGDAVKLAPKRIEIPGHIEHRASTSR